MERKVNISKAKEQQYHRAPYMQFEKIPQPSDNVNMNKDGKDKMDHLNFLKFHIKSSIKIFIEKTKDYLQVPN